MDANIKYAKEIILIIYILSVLVLFNVKIEKLYIIMYVYECINEYKIYTVIFI